MRRLATPALSAVLLTALAGGCARYRYSVIDPGQPDLTVVKDQDLVVPATPARLRLRQVESRCVLLVENPTADPITLDGGGSTIVDPAGQSRQIAGQLIAPGSFVKFVLPPLADRPPTGPQFEVGFGAIVEADAPRPAAYLDIGRSQEYWEWTGPGDVRVILSLNQNDRTAVINLVVRRVKV